MEHSIEQLPRNVYQTSTMSKKENGLTVQPLRSSVSATFCILWSAENQLLHLEQGLTQLMILKVVMIKPRIAGEFHPEPNLFNGNIQLTRIIANI